MITFLKAKLKKSDVETNIYKYTVTANRMLQNIIRISCTKIYVKICKNKIDVRAFGQEYRVTLLTKVYLTDRRTEGPRLIIKEVILCTV